MKESGLVVELSEPLEIVAPGQIRGVYSGEVIRAAARKRDRRIIIKKKGRLVSPLFIVIF
jgi:hypothetical protein